MKYSVMVHKSTMAAFWLLLGELMFETSGKDGRGKILAAWPWIREFLGNPVNPEEKYVQMVFTPEQVDNTLFAMDIAARSPSLREHFMYPVLKNLTYIIALDFQSIDEVSPDVGLQQFGEMNPN